MCRHISNTLFGGFGVGGLVGMRTGCMFGGRGVIKVRMAT